MTERAEGVRIRYRLWSAVDNWSLPRFVPYRWRMRFYRWTLDHTERHCND